MIRRTLYILFICLCGNASGQVYINGVLQFTNPNDSLRQIQGISPADSSTDALTQYDYLHKRFFDNEVSISDSTFYISTGTEYLMPQAGATIFILVPSLADTLNTPRYVKINTLSKLHIRGVNTSTLGNDVVKSGRVLTLVFTGTEFICINQPVYQCPAGYRQMNENYCIQVNRNPQATFWNANQNCINQGAHLCTFQEWYFACTHNTGLNQLPLNFEWIHTTSNHNIHALKSGNGGSCQGLDSETTAVTGLPMYYRCCYSLR